MLVGWTASKFDGGSQIQGYVVFVNGEELEGCEPKTASGGSCVMEKWQYSTSYEVEVAAYNEIGLSVFATDLLTTIDDPTPPSAMYQYPGPIFETVNPSTAPTGKVVLVTGQRLDLITRMWIGGLETEFSAHSSGRLSFKVPFGLADATYDIVVESSFGRLTIQNALRVMGAPVNETLKELPAEDSAAAAPGDQLPIEQNPDIDGDGVPNGLDPDIDGDGIPNELDPNPLVPNDPSEALDQPRPTNGDRPESNIVGDDSTEVAAQGAPDNSNLIGIALVLLVTALAGGFVIRRRLVVGGRGN